MLLPEVHVDEPVTISVAADLLGITVDTIRYYEKEGIAPPPDRGPDGWRRYDTAALSWLAGTVMLRGTGMSGRNGDAPRHGDERARDARIRGGVPGRC